MMYTVASILSSLCIVMQSRLWEADSCWAG